MSPYSTLWNLGEDDGDNAEDDDQDVVYIESSVEPTPNLNLMRKDPLRESHDDEGDVVYISSQGSRTDQTDPEAEDDSETEGDDNGNMIINPVQLHLSYEDSQDVEIYQIQDNRVSLNDKNRFPNFEKYLQK